MAAATGSQPDVLLLTVDTLRRDVMAPYGKDLMPRTSDFLARGVMFDRCMAPSSWTAPSFGSVLTGLWPRQHGCLAKLRRLREQVERWPLRHDVRMLPETLHDAGFHTICVNANVGYLSPQLGFGRGFDFWWSYLGSRMEKERRALEAAGFGRYVAHVAGKCRSMLVAPALPERSVMQNGETLVTVALRALERARGDRPAFVWINFMDVHSPYTATPRWMPSSEAPGRVRPAHMRPRFHMDETMSPEDRAYCRRRYENSVRYTDFCIGRLLAGWADRRRRPRLTVFLSDHGEEFWDHGDGDIKENYYRSGCEHGHTLYNELVHVPLAFHWPEGGLRTRRSEDLVSLVDVTPTLLELLDLNGGAPPMAGTSLARRLTSAHPEETDRVLFADSVHFMPERQAAMNRTHKLIRCPKTNHTELYAYGDRDAQEQENVAAAPEASEVRRHLEAQLDRWNKTLADVQHPSNAVLSAEEEAALLTRLEELGYA